MKEIEKEVGKNLYVYQREKIERNFRVLNEEFEDMEKIVKYEMKEN